jgi:hypothetical protein
VPLRLIVGLGFIEHGYAKLARGGDEFIAILPLVRPFHCARKEISESSLY